MDKIPLKNGFGKDVKPNADHGESLFSLQNSEISDSALINQSIVISGNVNNIHDISNNCTSDELNTNIDALTPDKKKIFFGGVNDVESLNENIVKPLKNHCLGRYNTFPVLRNKSDLYKSKKLNAAMEIPQVEIQSREESDGRFRVKFHIKGFEKL